MTLIDTVVILVVAAAVGGAGIFAGVRLLVHDGIDVADGLVIGVVGAVVWAGASAVLSLPVVGPLLALVVWTTVIGVRYPSGWPTASALGFVVWLVPTGLLFVLGTLGVVSFAAVGVPVVYPGG